MVLKSENSLHYWRKIFFACSALFILIIAIYSNTFNADWQFDDEFNILNNRVIQISSLSYEEIRDVIFVKYKGKAILYRPIAFLSFALNYYFGKFNVIGYHWVNISIHFIASLFLFLFMLQVLGLPLLKTKYGQNAYAIALLSAVFWAISPLQTQAVTYIVQRMASMAAMFYVMSMYFYVKGRTSHQFPLKILWYVFSVISGFLALGSKENAAMLPISILLLDLFVINGLTKIGIRKHIIILASFFLIILFFVFLIGAPTKFNPRDLIISGYGFRSFTITERLLTESRVLLYYISLLMYPMPHRLCIEHDIVLSHGLINPPTTMISILVICIILGAALLKAKKWPLIAYCIVFFFVNHIIESSIFPLELVYEHRNYLPSMIFFVPFMIIIVRSTDAFSKRRFMKYLIISFITFVLIGHGHSTYMRNFAWKTGESLWADAVDKNPTSSRALNNLGKFYGQKGNYKGELALYQKALRLGGGPNRLSKSVIHYNMAMAYGRKNKTDMELYHLLKTIEIYPSFPNAHTNIGVIFMQKKEYDLALIHFNKSLRHDKNDYHAHNNIGHILLRKGNIEQSIKEFKVSLRINSHLASALRGLGIAYKQKNDYEKAYAYLRNSLEKDKNSIITRLHIIETLLLMKNEPLLKKFLSETSAAIPFHKMKRIIMDLKQDKFPYEMSPDLNIIIPVLTRIYPGFDI